MAANSEPGCTASSGAKSSMLNVLLPKTLPMAKSIAPMRTAANDETNSGNDVLKATSVVPTNVLPSPVNSAISPADLASHGPVKTSTAAAAAKPSAGFHQRGCLAAAA